MTALDYLADRDRIHAASTPGEWRAYYQPEEPGGWHGLACDTDDGHSLSLALNGASIVTAPDFEDMEPCADFQFIADAHEQMPRLTAALRAVLALHTERERPGLACLECLAPSPCPTRRAIEALTEKEK